MMKRRYYGNSKERNDDNDYTDMRVRLPKELLRKYQREVHGTARSLSSIVVIAMDNELERDKPFQYDISIPREKYEAYKYADEAGKILNFLLKFKNGIMIETLMAVRRDIAINDRSALMNGVRELNEQKQATIFFKSDIGLEGIPFIRASSLELETREKKQVKSKDKPEYL